MENQYHDLQVANYIKRCKIHVAEFARENTKFSDKANIAIQETRINVSNPCPVCTSTDYYTKNIPKWGSTISGDQCFTQFTVCSICHYAGYNEIEV